MVTITPEEINNNGLLSIIGDKLRSIQVQIIPPFDSGSYSGCRLSISHNTPWKISTVSCNYAFVWIFGIISSFKGNFPDKTIQLLNAGKRTNILADPNFTNQSSTSFLHHHPYILSKQFFPLVNGGINKMVASSNELVTSQYINGFKTATLASISANDQNTSIHQLNNFNPRTPQLKLIRGFFMLKNTLIHLEMNIIKKETILQHNSITFQPASQAAYRLLNAHPSTNNILILS